MGHDKTEFAEFFQASWEPCLRAVVASTGSVQLAEDQVAEAFAKAWLSWRKVRRHPAAWAGCPLPVPGCAPRWSSAGGWGSAGPAPQARPAPQHDALPVHLAAFSVVAGPDGTTTLTLYPGQVAKPNAVRRALAERGIPPWSRPASSAARPPSRRPASAMW